MIMGKYQGNAPKPKSADAGSSSPNVASSATRGERCGGPELQRAAVPRLTTSSSERPCALLRNAADVPWAQAGGHGTSSIAAHAEAPGRDPPVHPTCRVQAPLRQIQGEVGATDLGSQVRLRDPAHAAKHDTLIVGPHHVIHELGSAPAGTPVLKALLEPAWRCRRRRAGRGLAGSVGGCVLRATGSHAELPAETPRAGSPAQTFPQQGSHLAQLHAGYIGVGHPGYPHDVAA